MPGVVVAVYVSGWALPNGTSDHPFRTQPKEHQVSKRGRKKRDRKKSKANHGRRPNS